jgi:hypothetical protein
VNVGSVGVAVLVAKSVWTWSPRWMTNSGRGRTVRGNVSCATHAMLAAMLRKYGERDQQQHCNKWYSIFHSASCETALLYSARMDTLQVVGDAMQPANGDNCHLPAIEEPSGHKT